MTNTIIKSRTGIFSGSLGDGSGKIYNKKWANFYNKILFGSGHILNGISLLKSEYDYKTSSITKERRNFNRLNSATSIAFPIAGLPIAIGDYLGQKYHPTINKSVTNGSLNVLTDKFLQNIGISTTPYQNEENQQKK